jgi:cyclophilin family peptidyl-prolyl cis-trans isomerase
MAFKCYDCDGVFNEPKILKEPHGEKIACCPYCNGSFDEANGVINTTKYNNVVGEKAPHGWELVSAANGNGTGGPGYTIKCETSAERQYHDRGVLSMAHRGKDTGGSQFFICHNRQNTQHLDGVHTCFGKVVEGEDVIDDIRPGDLILSITIVEE